MPRFVLSILLLSSLGATLAIAQNFSAPTPLDASAASDLQPTIAPGGNGHWIAVWSSDNDLAGTIGTDIDLLLAISADSGATWSAPRALNSNASDDLGGDFKASLATDRGGTWLAAWVSQDDLGGIGTDNDILFSRSNDNGTSWSPPAPIDPGATVDTAEDDFVDLATDGAGNWVAVWQSENDLGGTIDADEDILVSRSTDDGISWTVPQPLDTTAATDAEGDFAPVVSSDQSGAWIAVWISYTTGGHMDLVFARSTDNGATWTAPSSLQPGAEANGPDSVNLHDVATDASGSWVTVWASSDDTAGAGPDFDLFSSRSTDNGVTWKSATPFAYAGADAPSDGFEGLPSLATDGIGTWLVVWMAEIAPITGGNIDIVASRSVDDGATWTTPIALTLDNAFENAPAFAGDTEGRWIAIWETGGDIVSVAAVTSHVVLKGSAQGGNVTLVLAGTTVTTGTAAGESATDVAVNITSDINADVILQLLGISAYVSGSTVFIDGTAQANVEFSTTDPGLTLTAPPLAFLVNSTTDAVDANPGDRLCASTAGECTLRAAIMETNAVPGADSINVPAGTYVLTISGTGEDASATGDLDITDGLSLSGAGMDLTVVDANGIDTVVSVLASAGTTSVSDLSLVNGSSAANTTAGGIVLRGTALSNARVSDCTGSSAGGILDAGFGSTISDSIIERNSGGTVGGILNVFDLEVRRSSIVNNLGSTSGGIFDGGLILVVRDSLIAGNIAGDKGGGIWPDGGDTIFINTTISGNTADYGGGIYYDAGGPVMIYFSTITDNTANVEGGGIYSPLQAASPTTLRGALIAGNHAPVAPDCHYDPNPIEPPGIESFGFNLIGIGDDCVIVNDPTDRLGSIGTPIDPLLGPLANNGGLTLSHLPAFGSSAVEAVPLADCTFEDTQQWPFQEPTLPLTSDQRGIPRAQRLACDIGAVELDAPTYSLISGKRIAFSDKSSRPGRRRLNVRSRDGSIATPAPGSAADPTAAGALLQVFNPATAEYESTLLPPSHWKGLGSPAGSRGYRYRDSDLANGPCRVVTLLTGKRLSAFCQRDQLDLTLDEPSQGSLGVTLEFADRAYCMEFGGNIRSDFGHGGDGNGRFSARDAPAPAACPLP